MINGRPFRTLSSAIAAGHRKRRLTARGDYYDPRTRGGSALFVAAEATARERFNVSRPGDTLAALDRYAQLLKLMVVCPVCSMPAFVDEIVELHLNDTHGWSRSKIIKWVREQERYYAWAV